MGMFVIWALRGDVVAQEPVTYERESDALTALRALDVPALAMCDGVCAGASGVTRPAHQAAIRAALPPAPRKRRGGVHDTGLACAACGGRAAPAQERLHPMLAALCALDRAAAQSLRGGKSGLSIEDAVERVVEKRRTGRAA